MADVFIHMSTVLICVLRHVVCLAGRSAVLCDKNIKHFMQSFLKDLFKPAMLLGTIDLFHGKPLSVNLILGGGHKVSAEQNLLASLSFN